MSHTKCPTRRMMAIGAARIKTFIPFLFSSHFAHTVECLSRNLLLKQSRGAITSLWSCLRSPESCFITASWPFFSHSRQANAAAAVGPMQASNKSELFPRETRELEKNLLNAVLCVSCKFMSCLLLFIYFTPVRRYFFIRIFAFVVLVV